MPTFRIPIAPNPGDPAEAWWAQVAQHLQAQGISEVCLTEVRRIDTLAFWLVPNTPHARNRNAGRLLRSDLRMPDLWARIIAPKSDFRPGIETTEHRWADALGPRLVVRLSIDEDEPGVWNYQPVSGNNLARLIKRAQTTTTTTKQ